MYSYHSEPAESSKQLNHEDVIKVRNQLEIFKTEYERVPSKPSDVSVVGYGGYSRPNSAQYPSATTTRLPVYKEFRIPTYRAVLARKGYLIRNTLGSGTYSKVKSAYHVKSDGHVTMEVRKIAVKIIDREKAPMDYQKNFLPRELKFWPTLVHPNIIQMLDHFSDGRRVYMILEYASQGDCLKYIQKMGALPEAAAKNWLHQVCDAVKYLHEMDIAHRDLKLENLLLDSKMRIKICDFGFVKHKSSASELSQTYCGSKSYAAPEILKGIPYDPKKSDIWAIGVILYIFVTGKMPYDESKGNKRILEHQLRLDLAWPSDSTKISSVCKRLITNMFVFDYKERPNIHDVMRCGWFYVRQDTRLAHQALLDLGLLPRIATRNAQGDHQRSRRSDSSDEFCYCHGGTEVKYKRKHS